ncbi:4-hydroxybutyryl-CoA dehydratase [Sulfodiicoccus acidiphilus]|uniref:4-hydroxybutyryl-CoA dehydratase n=1 Tax=Sulfodiicoccus acidiphilus TaxID=1670455 RepID=A0A348B711_9CREN|nr:4-hydroxyphenylacetate 3-hydroxylase N-terminal domain-containing protein [Sulfodiicoccus acidiphilus]BBD73963.1 4-hydroxybutyryl-CoA dehydratase [Sulfodiicoccus acidiphilus]
MRTPEDYLNGLNDGRNVFYKGKRINNIVEHDALKVPALHAAHLYELKLADPTFRYSDPELGEISGFFRVPTDSETLWYRSRIIQESTRSGGGVFNIIQAIGSDAIFALLLIGRELLTEGKEEFLKRVKKYRDEVATKDLALAVAQTDVKGDRSKRPHEQSDPDLYVRVVGESSDGIVVRGAKAHTTQAAVADEIIFIPSRAMSEQDADYSIAFAVPANSNGLKMIVRPIMEIEGLPSKDDAPNASRHVELETLTILDDVFVPWERVFLYRDHREAGALANLFALYHRFTALSYRTAMADMYIGLSKLAARYNGVEDAPHVRDDIVDIVMYREVMYMAARTAAVDCVKVGDMAIPNPIYTNVGKLYSNSHFHDVVRDLIDVAGGSCPPCQVLWISRTQRLGAT